MRERTTRTLRAANWQRAQGFFNSSSCVSTIAHCPCTGGCTCKFDSMECESGSSHGAVFFPRVSLCTCNYYSIGTIACVRRVFNRSTLGKLKITPCAKLISFSKVTFLLHNSILRKFKMCNVCGGESVFSLAMGITALTLVNLQLLRCACNYISSRHEPN